MQIEQVLQIEAKLLQIGAAPVVTNWGNSYYKSGQFQLLQIKAVPLITNRGKIITNLGSYYKLGQNYYKSGQVLQIGAIITNRCRTTCV